MFDKKKAADGPYDCPATGFKERCRKEACPEWVHIYGKDPQTDAPVDMFDCARRWMPILLIQLARETNFTTAAVNSMRNESRKDTAALATALLRQPIEMGQLVLENEAHTPALLPADKKG